MKPYRLFYVDENDVKIYAAKYRAVKHGFDVVGYRYTYRADQSKAKVFRYAQPKDVLTQLKSGVLWQIEVVEKPKPLRKA